MNEFIESLFSIVDDIPRQSIFSELPFGLPVSEYPEISVIENNINYKDSTLPEVNLTKIEQFLDFCISSIPFMENSITEEFLPIYEEFMEKYNNSLDKDFRKKIVNKKLFPFFKDWVIFESSYLFLLQKMRIVYADFGENSKKIN